MTENDPTRLVAKAEGAKVTKGPVTLIEQLEQWASAKGAAGAMALRHLANAKAECERLYAEETRPPDTSKNFQGP